MFGGSSILYTEQMVADRSVLFCFFIPPLDICSYFEAFASLLERKSGVIFEILCIMFSSGNFVLRTSGGICCVRRKRADDRKRVSESLTDVHFYFHARSESLPLEINPDLHHSLGSRWTKIMSMFLWFGRNKCNVWHGGTLASCLDESRGRRKFNQSTDAILQPLLACETKITIII